MIDKFPGSKFNVSECQRKEDEYLKDEGSSGFVCCAFGVELQAERL